MCLLIHIYIFLVFRIWSKYPYVHQVQCNNHKSLPNLVRSRTQRSGAPWRDVRGAPPAGGLYVGMGVVGDRGGGPARDGAGGVSRAGRAGRASTNRSSDPKLATRNLTGLSGDDAAEVGDARVRGRTRGRPMGGGGAQAQVRRRDRPPRAEDERGLRASAESDVNIRRDRG